MLKQPVNELRITLRLEAVSPLIVKDGRFDTMRERLIPEAERQRVPNVLPISRATDDELEAAIQAPNRDERLRSLPFYVPGTSIRGAWRAHLERMLRTQEVPGAPKICDPLEDGCAGPTPSASCSSELTGLRKELAPLPSVSFVPYRRSCPVCRLFGSTLQGSRIQISDGTWEPGTCRLVTREHVAINRKNGAALRGALVRFAGLQGGAFEVNVAIRNFELWHVAMVGMLISDLRKERVPLGFGKNKGYGRVRATIKKIVVEQFGLTEPGPLFTGVAEDPVWGKEFQKQYDLIPMAAPPLWPADELSAGNNPDTARVPWRHERTLSEPQFWSIVTQILVEWREYWKRIGLLSARREAGEVTA